MHKLLSLAALLILLTSCSQDAPKQETQSNSPAPTTKQPTGDLVDTINSFDTMSIFVDIGHLDGAGKVILRSTAEIQDSKDKLDLLAVAYTGESFENTPLAYVFLRKTGAELTGAHNERLIQDISTNIVYVLYYLEMEQEKKGVYNLVPYSMGGVLRT